VHFRPSQDKLEISFSHEFSALHCVNDEFALSWSTIESSSKIHCNSEYSYKNRMWQCTLIKSIRNVEEQKMCKLSRQKRGETYGLGRTQSYAKDYLNYLVALLISELMCDVIVNGDII
jgi:hypothetical protein